MTDEDTGSSIPRRNLGRMMRQAREQARLSLEEAAARIGKHEVTVRRMEQGTHPSSPGNIALLADLYGLAPDRREELIDLARETKAKGWWQSYNISPRLRAYVSLEVAASRATIFDPLLVPGLLQTPRYADVAIRADNPDLTPEEIDTRIEIRQRRQSLLTRTIPPAPELRVVLAEAALLVRPGNGIMADQAHHLIEAARLPQVSLMILPVGVGPHRASVAGAFTILDFPAAGDRAPEGSVVYSEGHTGAIYLDKPGEVGAYTEVWESLEKVSLNPADTITLLHQLRKELHDAHQ